MKLDQKLEAGEIVSEAGLREFLRAAKTDVDNTEGQKISNPHIRMQVAFQGGALMEAITHKPVLSATAKFQSEWMGMLAAATAPTAEKSYKLEQTLDQNFQQVESQRPASTKINLNLPKNGL